MRINVPDTRNISVSLKHCILSSKIHCLQKKDFHGKAKFKDLVDVIIKHKEDNYFVPLSKPHNAEIPALLDKNNIKYTIGILYKTISRSFSDPEDFDYDILVFYSPSGIKSLKENFPEFIQGDIKIAAFGPQLSQVFNKKALGGY